MQTKKKTKIIKEWLDENNLDYNQNLSKFGHGHIMLQFTENNNYLADADGQKVTGFNKLNTKAEIRDQIHIFTNQAQTMMKVTEMKKLTV